MSGGSIVDVPGIKVGHFTNLDAATGCTVVLCERPMVGGCLVSGSGGALSAACWVQSHP